VANILHQQGKRVAWFRTSDYLDQIRAAPFEDLANRMMDIGYQHLIVLDDLMAAHFRTEWSHERINQLVDMAWERPKQAMIITTNMPAEEIPPRILDRLTDRECGRVCVMAGVSWRQDPEERGK
jgi:DNA replication protein DnaC